MNARATNKSTSNAVAHSRIQKPARGVTEKAGGGAAIGAGSGVTGVGSDAKEFGGFVPLGGGGGTVAFTGGSGEGLRLRNIAITAAPSAIVVMTPHTMKPSTGTRYTSSTITPPTNTA